MMHAGGKKYSLGTFVACASVMAAVCLLGPMGCSDAPGPVDIDTSRAAEFGFQQSVRTSQIEEGHAAYKTFCIGCHGEAGDGNGNAARFLDPRPRNFINARFKFSSTRAGQLPTDEDLRGTIIGGLKGSSMPGWDMLPARTVTALVSYIKTFSPKWQEKSPASAIPSVDDPYRASEDKAEAIARGEAVYHGYATCWTCHPSYVPTEKINEHLVAMENSTRDVFRDHLFQPVGKPNAEGEMVYPPDFKRDFVRAGAQVDILYRSIAAGISGTAMPTWVDSMDVVSSHDSNVILTSAADLWALSYYVQSLVISRPARLEPDELVVRARPQKILQIGEAFVPVEEVIDTGETDEEFSEDD